LPTPDSLPKISHEQADMEERYEIKSKIGQGGFGAVYRALDKRMNREVAIKRINTSDEDGMLEEASRQLSKEAGALASMQHPNIVTVYDVGSDEDGPYVVMELLSGSPLDDLVDNAPLTWDDFRELALQTQEALIGAQELDLVHRDIKPANVMLTWLPSGKFQVKLLDFGLAKLTQRPSLQTLNQADSIFGSIFFMSPEQFERSPIDRRTDMYAMGCVYYYALTGTHPFDGATAVQVMSAHLHHDFVPLDEMRPDLPRWVCDWVMWHMNRYPDDRPESAKDALQVFIQNDKYPPVEAPPPAPDPPQSGRPRLLIPGAEPLVPAVIPEQAPEPTENLRIVTKTAPQPLIPPTGKPNIHSTRQVEVEETVYQEGPVVDEPDQQQQAAALQIQQSAADATQAMTRTARVITRPQKILTSAGPNSPENSPVGTVSPGAGALRGPGLATGPTSAAPSPSITPQTGPFALVPPKGAAPGATQSGTAPAGPAAYLPDPPKAASSNGAKIAIAAIIGLLVVLAAFFLIQKLGDRKAMAEYNDVIRLAAHPEAESVPMNKAMLHMMLRTAMTVSSNTERETVYRALFLATSTDGTDVDAEIVRFVMHEEMMDNVRNVLLSQVLRRRENPNIVAPLLDFVSNTKVDSSAVAALQAVRNMVNESHFDGLLNTLQFSANVEVRRAAEEALGEIIKGSSNRSQYASKLHGIFKSSVNDDARHAALRLSGLIADQSSLAFVREIFGGRVAKDQIAALTALQNWGNDDGFPVLVSFMNSTDDAQLRLRAFDSGLRYAAKLDEKEADEGQRREVWTELASNARSEDEMMSFVRSIAVNHNDEWVIGLLEKFKATGNPDRVIDVADRAISSVKGRRNQSR